VWCRCFNKAPEKRPADAGVMLAEWDEADAAAEAAILQKAQGRLSCPMCNEKLVRASPSMVHAGGPPPP